MVTFIARPGPLVAIANSYGGPPVKMLAACVVAATVVLTADARGQSTAPATAKLAPGDRVAVCGDSITEQHLYSADIEAYLILCRPTANVAVEQFGWGGETAGGFLDKMPQFMLPFGNTVATTCYGMNDGRYGPVDDGIAKAYHQRQTAIVRALKAGGVRCIVVGSPGMVDTETFDHGNRKAEVYNRTLAALRDVDRQVAQEQGVAFADVYGAMGSVMAKAKATFGDAYRVKAHKPYPVCGPDGVHPNANGHLVMAYAFLKAMGVSGDIGTVTFDGVTQQATATDGHNVLSCSAGTIQLESTRYPFCFSGDPASPDATTGMAQLLPFNDELNRFRLVATNVGSDKVRVTFGPTSKDFPAADLAKGINLAAEFTDNPFGKAFADEMRKVQVQQAVETQLDKNFYDLIPQYQKQVPEAAAAYAGIEPAVRDLIGTQAKDVAAGVPAVRYTIKVEPVR